MPTNFCKHSGQNGQLLLRSNFLRRCIDCNGVFISRIRLYTTGKRRHKSDPAKYTAGLGNQSLWRCFPLTAGKRLLTAADRSEHRNRMEQKPRNQSWLKATQLQYLRFFALIFFTQEERGSCGKLRRISVDFHRSGSQYTNLFHSQQMGVCRKKRHLPKQIRNRAVRKN